MDFKLPDIGEGVHEGEITRWLVKEGDTISADQPMVEVMTDKATVEIPAPVSGVVDKLNAKEGETVPVGKVLLVIREGGSAPAAKAAPAPAAPARNPSDTPAPAPQQKSSPSADESSPSAHSHEPIPFGILATPATRKLARDLGVDLKAVKGTGFKDRVTKLDVQMAYEGVQAATSRPSHTTAGVKSSSSLPARIQPLEVGALQRIPLKGLRRKIAEAMTRSKHPAAHFTYVEEVDMSAVVALRKSHKAESEKRGIKLTYLPFIVKALVPCLKEFPYLNSSLDDAAGEIILKGDHNIGIATDTPAGLIVPVIQQVDHKTIWELAEEIEVLSNRAKEGKSAVEDLRGGTFTITNAGSIGGVFATPVINHPEVAILGVNSIRKRPVVEDDAIVIREMMFLSLSVDHRVVDGADAARFMNRLIYFLADPQRLVFA